MKFIDGFHAPAASPSQWSFRDQSRNGRWLLRVIPHIVDPTGVTNVVVGFDAGPYAGTTESFTNSDRGPIEIFANGQQFLSGTFQVALGGGCDLFLFDLDG